MPAVIAYIGLGANLGDAAATLTDAIEALGRLPQSRLVRASSLYGSKPVGYLDQPDFINAVAAVETALAPHDLLDALLALESHFGRQRTFRNAPRTLDMDVLLYGNMTHHDDRLTVPHPRMLERSFVLVPLAEIAPDLTLPEGQQVVALAEGCDRTGLNRL
ncbi:MAG: 2-amino-4-hydroxy-6-hydroxymethyldihydropteridine diphosphokinase [Burkholderiales bacterium]|nr:2-amino-4-hydroxy-6-hydroxymethyldihydropteridine diphosphokinase [Burkholderiales bacterium]